MAFSAIENQINTTENSIVMCSNLLLPLKFLIYYCFRLGLRLWPFWASYLRFLYQGTIVRLLIEEMGEPQHLLKPMLLAIVGFGSNENRAAGTNKGIPSQHDISTSKNLWNKRGLGFMKTLLLEQVTWNTTSNKGPFTLILSKKCNFDESVYYWLCFTIVFQTLPAETEETLLAPSSALLGRHGIYGLIQNSGWDLEGFID